MKTKDFIKMLERADPTGEAHIRMDGGIPVAALKVPGYYDGAYCYFDDNNNYVTADRDDKVDIYCVDVVDYVFDLPDELTLDEIKSRFIFDLYDSNWSNKNRIERTNSLIEKSKKKKMAI